MTLRQFAAALLPREGQQLQRGDQDRVVLRVLGHRVYYLNQRKRVNVCSLRTWLNWAARAAEQ